ncbi:MAG: MerR family DNA-binding transcriptional regulator [Ahrensia sp.]
MTIDTMTKSSNTEQLYRIGELASEFDVSLRTLRFYEDKDLLAPKRVGTTRLYTRADRGRLQLIMIAKRLGFSLVDIKRFLELYDPVENNRTQLNFVLEKGLAQMENLKEEEAKIKASMDELARTLQTVRNMLADINE